MYLSLHLGYVPQTKNPVSNPVSTLARVHTTIMSITWTWNEYCRFFGDFRKLSVILNIIHKIRGSHLKGVVDFISVYSDVDSTNVAWICLDVWIYCYEPTYTDELVYHRWANLMLKIFRRSF